MRFSNLITPENVQRIKAAIPRKPVKPAEHPVLSPAINPSVEKSPTVDRAAVEREIRERLENEFASKMQKMQEDIKTHLLQQEKEEARRSQEREQELRREQQKLSQALEEIDRQKVQWDQMVRDRLAAETQQRVETERKKAEQEFARQLEESRRTVDELQRRLSESRAANIQEASLPPPVAPEPVKPIAPVAPPVVKREEPPVPVMDLSVLNDPVRHEQARIYYDQLVMVGTAIFDSIAKKQALELEVLKNCIRDVRQFITQSDTEMIGVILGPYPVPGAFIFHAVNCAILAMILSLDFDMTPEDIDELGLATLLHDVGLISVREDLSYPKQLTTETEKEVIAHPERGVEILQPYVSERVVTAIRQHHEVCNGKGYPLGLQGEDIHKFAKIIHIADVFEALTHERPYRKKPFEVSAAMKEIIEHGRGIYDTQAMKAMMSRIGLYPVMSYVELSNKQVAKVLRLNHKFPLSPIVQVEFDEWGHKLDKPLLIDLRAIQMIHIVGPVKEAPASYHATKIKAAAEAVKVHKKSTPALIELIPLIFVLVALALLLYIVIKV